MREGDAVTFTAGDVTKAISDPANADWREKLQTLDVVILSCEFNHKNTVPNHNVYQI